MAWTKEQQKAIDTRDRTLLVSAAAGSGKTATLTERIIQSILSEENPTDIGRMLIATYTNAAVDELRERIGKAIKKAALDHPDNPRLEEQLLKLKDAKILTITAFCNSILRSCAESVGLAPNYRIAEPAEAKIISASVLEGLISAAYENEIPEVCTADEFIEVADCISNVKHSEGLSDAIAFIFEKLTYSERGIDTLAQLIEEYNPKKFESVEKTKIGAYVIGELKNALFSYASAYKRIISLAADTRLDEKNVNKAIADLAHVEKILAEESYENISLLISSFAFESLSKGKEDVTEFYSGFDFLRSHLREDIKKFRSELFFYSVDEWRDLYTKLYKLLGTLYKFLKKYNEVFMEEKRARGICEFSDVERYAYDALYNQDGSVTPLAHELSDKFDAIYVDEYQDVNALQGRIFAAISKENNRFMVGDIKQSIYGFRSARPEIFLNMKNRFPLIDSEGDYPAASIFMSNNFRCDSAVVDFVNGIFDKTFSLFADNIGYVSEDRLKFSKIYEKGDTPLGIIPEIHITAKPSSSKEDTAKDVADEILSEERSKNEIQAEAIAKKISLLLENGRLANGNPIEPKSIAILMRSVKGALAEAITGALKQHGIPSSINETGDLFLSEEVLLALSFLYSIDNPRKDVYLCALMLSPLFSFTADEIFKIRKSYPEQTLWDSLLSYVKSNPDYTRGRTFIASILKYRRLSEGERSDTLISMIYRESGLMTLASKNGSRDNLILLHSYARKYESNEFKGLYSFISYINAVIERGETFPAAAEGEEANAVRIMTVHRSKGLEFPVTILAGASSQSAKGDSAKIFFHENFGIAIKTKDDTGLAIIDNPVAHAIKRYIRSVEFDEELRVLYVALTRAREQLYIYASSPKTDTDEYLDSVEHMRDILSPYFASKSKSFLDIIMFSRDSGRLVKEESDAEPYDEPTVEPAPPILSLGEKAVSAASSPDYLTRFSFEYGKKHLEKLPKKISVSRLSPAMLNDDESAVGLDEISLVDNYLSSLEKSEEEISAEDTSAPTLPRFVTGALENESAKRGIATHKVLQFCDFKLLEQSPEQELERLIKSEFISREDGERVRLRELKAFVRSDLFSEMKTAKRLYRELRFNVFFDASDFTDDDVKKRTLENETVLVQGVIDCLIERTDGSLHLVDYKTDRLTREELADSSLAENRLKQTHTSQLSYYKRAVEEMFKKSPKSVGIYSLHLGREVALDI